MEELSVFPSIWSIVTLSAFSAWNPAPCLCRIQQLSLPWTSTGSQYYPSFSFNLSFRLHLPHASFVLVVGDTKMNTMRNSVKGSECERWHPGNAPRCKQKRRKHRKRWGNSQIRESGKNEVVEATRLGSFTERVISNIRYLHTEEDRDSPTRFVKVKVSGPFGKNSFSDQLGQEIERAVSWEVKGRK